MEAQLLSGSSSPLICPWESTSMLVPSWHLKSHGGSST
uniref:Uncharacterized protein n=1 Tax=Arundo donax TaxID=35708 RepID=A0A0A8ZT32_ARUDO